MTNSGEWWLPDDFLMTTSQLSYNNQNILTTSRQLTTSTAWQLPGDCLMTAWWLPDDCLMTVWWLPGDYLTTSWRLPDDCLTISWRLPDDCLTTTWRLPDNWGCAQSKNTLPTQNELLKVLWSNFRLGLDLKIDHHYLQQHGEKEAQQNRKSFAETL